MLRLSHALALTVATDELVRLMPDVDTARLGKALRIAAEQRVEYRESLGSYFYQSERSDRPYAIHIERALRTNNLHDAYCTCPDHIERNEPCKHILACWLQCRAKDILGAALQLRTISGLDTVERYVQWAFG